MDTIIEMKQEREGTGLGLNEKQLKVVNLCRMYMGVMWIDEITGNRRERIINDGVRVNKPEGIYPYINENEITDQRYQNEKRRIRYK